MNKTLRIFCTAFIFLFVLSATTTEANAGFFSFFKKIGRGIANIAKGAVNAVKKTVVGTFNAIKQGATSGFKFLKTGKLSHLVDMAKAGITAANAFNPANQLLTAINVVGSSVGGKFGNLLTKGAGLAETMQKQMQDQVINGAAGVAKSGVSFIKTGNVKHLADIAKTAVNVAAATNPKVMALQMAVHFIPLPGKLGEIVRSVVPPAELGFKQTLALAGAGLVGGLIGGKAGKFIQGAAKYVEDRTASKEMSLGKTLALAAGGMIASKIGGPLGNIGQQFVSKVQGRAGSSSALAMGGLVAGMLPGQLGSFATSLNNSIQKASGVKEEAEEDDGSVEEESGEMPTDGDESEEMMENSMEAGMSPQMPAMNPAVMNIRMKPGAVNPAIMGNKFAMRGNSVMPQSNMMETEEGDEEGENVPGMMGMQQPGMMMEPEEEDEEIENPYTQKQTMAGRMAPGMMSMQQRMMMEPEEQNEEEEQNIQIPLPAMNMNRHPMMNAGMMGRRQPPMMAGQQHRPMMPMRGEAQYPMMMNRGMMG